MTGKEKIIHRVSVNTGQPMVLPRHGAFALRRSRLMRRRFRQVFYTTGFLLSFAAIGQASYGFLMETPYFLVKAPEVQGVSESLRKEIVGLAASLTQNNKNLLSINAEDLEKQISLHPRIRDISVEKIYPDRLKIVAAERQEVAIIVTENAFHMLDKEGYVMEKLDPADLAKLKYPFIGGLRDSEVHEGEPIESASLRNAISLLEVLKARNEALYHQISEIEIQSDKVSPLETLTAHMKGGLDIKFGDSNPVEKLPALETLLQRLKSDGIKPFSDLVYIDLGYDGMGYYIDKETALMVKRNNYPAVQRAMDEAAEKYEKDHPEKELKLRYGPGGSEESSREHESTKNRTVEQTETKSSGRTPARKTAPAPAQPAGAYRQYYQQPARQQYYPNQYYQQPQPQRQQQRAPMYNLPANQQRY